MNHPQAHNHQNILCSGLVIAPIAAFSASFMQALAISFAFLSITALTVPLSALIPARLPASLRIVLYSVTGSLVYIPAALLTVQLFPQVSGGIYIPILSSALYLTVLYTRFFPRKGLWKSLLRNLIPVPAAALLTGSVRELLGSASFAGISMQFTPPLPLLLHPSGGLILLILLLTVISSANRREEQDADSH